VGATLAGYARQCKMESCGDGIDFCFSGSWAGYSWPLLGNVGVYYDSGGVFWRMDMSSKNINQNLVPNCHNWSSGDSHFKRHHVL